MGQLSIFVARWNVPTAPVVEKNDSEDMVVCGGSRDDFSRLGWLSNNATELQFIIKVLARPEYNAATVFFAPELTQWPSH